MEQTNEWWKTQVSLREKKVVVKLRKNDGSFWTSVQIPTVYWPLNGHYEVFHGDNTKEVTDEKVISIFDNTEYRLGRCYTNTKDLYNALRAAGYNVKTYAGWTFVLEDIPIHHAWLILEKDGEKSLLDLADDYPMSIGWQMKNVPAYPHVTREDHADWVEASLKMQNSVRCFPVGEVNPFWYYVGCECDPEEAVNIYQNLMHKYPGHMCDRTWTSGQLNPTQTLLVQRGLM